MRALFKCELDCFPSPHLNQIYDGFEKLRKAGIVNLSVKHVSGEQTKPLVKVLVNNKYNVIYDTLDGLNWIDGTIEENLNYFNKTIEADFYFKRSFNQQIIDYAPENCKVFPLGFNYQIKPEADFSENLQQKLKDLLRNNFILSRYYAKNSCSSRDFEFYPIPSKKSRILFMARLWNPDDVSLEHLKIEREQINKNRIDCIRACRKEFGDSFIGGLQKDNFSVRRAKDLLLPFSLTNKENFLKTVKECNICIATTGLHNSIGWKFGEYVAASRAIVSKPLKYQLPGDFSEGKNYLVFNNDIELMDRISKLLRFKVNMFDMMKRNFHYYNNYLQPDKLILNTLLKIYQGE